MTNKEILAELKRSYEYINDIIDNNDEQLKADEIKNLENINNKIDEIYFDFWNRCFAEENMEIPSEYQNDDKYSILIGSSAFTDYTIQNKETGEFDEEITTCGDLEYYWYDDDKFISY